MLQFVQVRDCEPCTTGREMMDFMAKLSRETSVFLAGALFALFFLLSGCGTTVLKPEIEAEVMMSAGKEVRLYYAGQQAAKEMFCIDEIVSVYRKEGKKYVEVGKVKVLRELDRNNLEALVVEGNVRSGDNARKSIAACKVRPLLPGNP